MNNFLKNAFLPAMLIVIAAIIAYCKGVDSAVAAPKPGLWWTSKTEGLAQVQKLEDTSNGVVCYLARERSNGTSPISISCVKP